jgi:hypothetical protein
MQLRRVADGRLWWPGAGRVRSSERGWRAASRGQRTREPLSSCSSQFALFLSALSHPSPRECRWARGTPPRGVDAGLARWPHWRTVTTAAGQSPRWARPRPAEVARAPWQGPPRDHTPCSMAFSETAGWLPAGWAQGLYRARSELTGLLRSVQWSCPAQGLRLRLRRPTPLPRPDHTNPVKRFC